MKTNSYFKAALLQLSVIISLFFLGSCNTTQKQEDTKDVAEEHNDAKFDSNNGEKDAQFLVNAAEISMKEIMLGQLAQQIGSTPHVKALGKMMEDAHKKSLDELTTLAKSKMITIPATQTDNVQVAYKSLNEKSGIDFDKAYADMMVSEHKDAISIFEIASSEGNDSDIRNWATTALPGLRKHLDSAMDCKKKCDSI